MKSIKSNFVFNLVLILSSFLFPLISFPYISRIIGPEGIGKVTFVITFAQYFALIASFGIPIYGVREVAKTSSNQKDLDKVVSELFLINLFSSMFMLALYLSIIFSLDKFTNNRELYVISACVILFSFTSIDWLYNGLQEFRFIAIRSVVIKLVSLLALFFFVKHKEDVEIYLWITIFSIISNNLWNIGLLSKRVKLGITDINIKRHLPFLVTLFSTSLSTSIYTVVDTLVLGFLTNEVTVGYYTAAIKINKVAIPLIVALGVVLIPQISKSITLGNFSHTQNLINKSFSFVCLIGVPVSLGLCIYAPEIMTLFSGREFIPAITTMQIAAPLVFLIGLGHVFGLQVLIPSGNEKSYLYATIWGMAASLVLNFLFIRMFKDKGAALATLLGEFVVTAVSYYFVVRKLEFRFTWSLFYKAVLCSATFIPVAFFSRLMFSDNITGLMVSFVLSSLIYFYMQVFLFKDALSWDAISSITNKLRSYRK